MRVRNVLATSNGEWKSFRRRSSSCRSKRRQNSKYSRFFSFLPVFLIRSFSSFSSLFSRPFLFFFCGYIQYDKFTASACLLVCKLRGFVTTFSTHSSQTVWRNSTESRLDGSRRTQTTADNSISQPSAHQLTYRTQVNNSCSDSPNSRPPTVHKSFDEWMKHLSSSRAAASGWDKT